MLSRKFESNTQDPPFASLDMNLMTMESNNDAEKPAPALVKKPQSEVKIVDYKQKQDDVLLNLKKGTANASESGIQGPTFQIG